MLSVVAAAAAAATRAHELRKSELVPFWFRLLLAVDGNRKDENVCFVFLQSLGYFRGRCKFPHPGHTIDFRFMVY